MSNAIESVGVITDNTTGRLNSSDINACYDYWNTYYPQSVTYPYYSNTICIDKGLQALSIVKALMNKKLVKLTTIKQFIDLMDELVKIL